MRLIDADKIPYVDLSDGKKACFVAFADKINQMPTIEPERKKGTWEPMFNGQFKGGQYWFSCSKCNRIVPEVRNGGWNYCPNCGAKMER